MSATEMDALSLLLERLRLSAGLFTDAQYCGNWAVDTSGLRMATFHLIGAGNCWLHVAHAPPRALRPGDFVLFPRDAPHRLTSAEVVPADTPVNEPPPFDPRLPSTRMLCGYFEFRSKAVWPLLDSLPDALVLDLAGNPSSDTKTLLNLMIGEAVAESPGRAAVVDRLAYVLFVHALRVHIQSGVSEGLLAALAHPQIGQVLGCVHGHPERAWTLAQLAAEAGMSRANLARKFRELVGDTPMNYLSAWRMQIAEDLLTATDQSMAQIGAAIGYQSEAAFRNAFKRATGRPPGLVRRSARAPKDTVAT